MLKEKGKDEDHIWSSISANQGSVQHLDFLSDDEKSIFKTAFELDQRWVIEFAADRTPLIDQSQSVNVFLPADIHKRDLHQIHYMAWKRGMKSLYYCRSKSIQRAEDVSTKQNIETNGEMVLNTPPISDLTQIEIPLAAESTSDSVDRKDYEECLACQ